MPPPRHSCSLPYDQNMSDVEITVRGEYETRTAPERATAHLTVLTEGPERQAVLDAASAAVAPVRESLVGREITGALAEWSSGRISVRAERPWNPEGKRLAPIYYASVEFRATFSEASELSLWVSDIAGGDGVEVGYVNWHLTPDTHTRVEREVATAAVGVAVARAEAYARALGRTEVVPVSLADQGLLTRTEAAQPMMVRAAMAKDSAGGPALEYEPEDIVVSATVEARFHAR